MTVYLVGAGPGDPGLLTRRAVELLADADVVVHDTLVDPAVLALARGGAEIVDAGTPRDAPGRQEAINELLVSRARAGRVVVRLKGGDPFLFGRGAEEAQALAAAGVDWEVVPGVSSASAVPAAAGIPVTQRGVSSSVTVVTGRVGDPTGPGGVDWRALARTGGTLVILMGVATRKEIAERLEEGGLAPETPVAVVHRGTTPSQRVVRTTLSGLAAVALESPAVTVVGPVAAFDLPGRVPRPLAGITVAVTRPRTQAAPTTAAFEAAGARVLAVPVVEIVEPDDGGEALRRAAAESGAYDWIAFTSASAVRRFMAHLPDVRAIGSVRLAAVGRGTAGALAQHHLVADLVPAEATAGGLAAAFPAPPPGGRVLFPRAADARGDLADGLRAGGWQVVEVTAYRAVPAAPPPPALVAALATADVVVFAAPSAVEAYFALATPSGAPIATPPLAAAIGPVTASAARHAGVPTIVEPAEPSPAALVAAVLAHLGVDGRATP